MNWKVHEEFAGEQFVGYVLKNDAGVPYCVDGAVETFLDEAVALKKAAELNLESADGSG